MVIDNGSYIVKAGFGGGSEPKSVFCNLIGSENEVSIFYIIKKYFALYTDDQFV